MWFYEHFNDVIRASLVIIVIIGAIIAVSLGKDIPNWLIVVISSVFSYYFGLISDTKKDDSQP